MTAPQADGADRISGVDRHHLGASAAVGSLAILLLVGLLLRLTIAYVLLPGSGFESDTATYSAWADRLYTSGPGQFYAEGFFADYPPGYLYVLWLGSHLFAFLLGPENAGPDLLKIGPIVFDILVAALLYGLVKRWTADRADSARHGLVAAGLYLFNPVTWYDSAVWGQTDAVGAFVILLGVGALVRGNSEGAMVAAVLAALVKPQFGIVLAPVVGMVLLRRHLFAPGSGPRKRPWIGGPIGRWLEREQGPWRLVSSAVVGLGVLIALLAPFGLDIFGFIRLVMSAASGYPWLSVNAYNPWALFGAGGEMPLFQSGARWSSDTVPFLGPIPAVVIGSLLLAGGFLLGAVRLGWRADRRSIVVVAIFLALAFFMLPTRVHERYMFPIFALLPLLAVVDRRWMVATAVLSIAAFINLHGVLTTELYATPNIENLPLGDLFRQPLGKLTSIALHVGGFLFIGWQLRPAASKEPDPYEVSAVATGSASDAEVDQRVEASMPAGRAWLSVFAPLLGRRSLRRDRSALLLNESGGRLDRRDAALLLLFFVSALLLRTYRLEVPYAMHFDEVYHARTAVEFLQHWRYDKPHSIYEFTHPHLAKYGMALGIVALGNNRVVQTSELGVEVRSAATEARWSPAGAAVQRNGDRLYLATGNELRVHDLGTRALIAQQAVPVSALAVDEDDHVLYLGAADGRVSTIATASFDDLRTSDAQAPAAQELAQLENLAAPLERLAVAGDRLIAIASDGTLISLDPLTGFETGRAQLSEPADVVEIPARDLVTVDPTQVTDQAAVAQTLADLLDDDAARIEALIGAAFERALVAGFVGDKAEEIQTAIDDGELPGVSVQDGSGVAVATASGVLLLDADSLTELASFPTDAPVTGIALIERGPDQPTVYAANGSRLMTVRLPPDQPSTQGEPITMPNSVQSVVWNEATTLVHVLGRSPDGGAATVYLIEPRSNSVFADARLEFEPQVLLADVAPDYPAEDRNDLLAIDGGGRLATIDSGNNQFAYRFPGVLLGALMAACIYLLARFLFARRSVAVIAGLLVLADGMFFANARIAMNDAYVSFFIVAAFTLFVPLWTGRWRGRLVTASGLAGVGILLGLALASKWVGAYAIGALLLMVLLRSALGRLVALVAMIGMTAVLGYIAITPNPSVENAQLNYIFLALMVGLTTLLAVGMAVRPVRVTREEVDLAIGAPIVVGAAITAAAALIGLGVREIAVGVGLMLFGLIAGVVSWRRRYGRWTRPPVEETWMEPAAPPPPRGWLRPGSGLLGIPWLASLAALTLIPLMIYALSYVPWIELGNRWTETIPAGNTGQTFLDLQRSMYDYHNNLRATHAASSPWWAWPLDLKPVWFEQQDYAGRTTAVIYDTGNLVIFWLAIPAVAFVAWQAWRRRSLALTFLALSIASLWLPWARIDRATFQYHIFTALPFSFLALAYFLAELWHGPSARTWALARIGAALAIIGAPLLWLLRLPLCGIARTETVNEGTEVCAALSRQLALTDIQMLGLLMAAGGLIGAGLLVYARLRTGDADAPPTLVRSLLLPVSFSVALLGVAIIVVGAGLPGSPVLQMQVRAEEPALVALLLLAVPAYFVLRATDPRRFVIGALAAAAIWFVAFYPNFASLPVPTPLSQIHLGLLPTWNWGFQFGVNLDEPNRAGIDWTGVVLLAVAVTALAVAAAYAARSWYVARNAEETLSALPETS